MDVGVVGCGIAGLTASYYLLINKAVSNVVLFERRTLIPHKHCTGLISLETLSRLPLASRFVGNMYRSIVFFIHGIDFGLEITADRYFACRINRVDHEIELMHSLSEMGATINLGCEVSNIAVDRERLLIHVRNADVCFSTNFDRVVIAEGYPPVLSRKCGLNAKYNILKSLQGEVALSNSLTDEQLETLYVFISPRVFGGGFAWLVPMDRRRVVVGYSTEYGSSLEGIEIVKLIFKKILELSYRSTEDVYGGVTLQGYPLKISTDTVVGIGDAVAMVKSISGGGLYAISVASKLCSKTVDLGNGESYRELKGLLNTLKVQYTAKNIVWSLLKIIKPKNTSIGKVSRLIHFNPSYIDYDRHELLMYTLLNSIHNIKLKGI
ncbi:MAG: hypothetical protein N3D82_02480 [Ignisphaera sp.]|nr:hypothetical protein [Ignisphaera sp.]MCX8167884.1 hypothetical protein [Ignisphaera sp.]MDW8085475.1 hypothetical protein [Ignisphaera sp.]